MAEPMIKVENTEDRPVSPPTSKVVLVDSGLSERPIVKIEMDKDVVSIPRYTSPGAAAFDLAVFQDTIVPVCEKGLLVGTGLKIRLPPNWGGLVIPRSSLFAKLSLELVLGCLDSDHCGPVNLNLINRTKQPIGLLKGQRVAQLMVTYAPQAILQFVDKVETTDRVEGFGAHSGL